jgi:hypothetical protein
VDSYAAVAEARKAYHAVVRAPSKGWLDSACRRWKAVTVKPNSEVAMYVFVYLNVLSAHACRFVLHRTHKELARMTS